MSQIIERNRTIRPSGRLKSSNNYKIDVKSVGKDTDLTVNITHESLPFYKSFKFDGKQLATKNSISFSVLEIDGIITISWSGAIPI